MKLAGNQILYHIHLQDHLLLEDAQLGGTVVGDSTFTNLRCPLFSGRYHGYLRLLLSVLGTLGVELWSPFEYAVDNTKI